MTENGADAGYLIAIRQWAAMSVVLRDLVGWEPDTRH
jgi:hypothetical protein